MKKNTFFSFSNIALLAIVFILFSGVFHACSEVSELNDPEPTVQDMTPPAWVKELAKDPIAVNFIIQQTRISNQLVDLLKEQDLDEESLTNILLGDEDSKEGAYFEKLLAEKGLDKQIENFSLAAQSLLQKYPQMGSQHSHPDDVKITSEQDRRAMAKLSARALLSLEAVDYVPVSGGKNCDLFRDCGGWFWGCIGAGMVGVAFACSVSWSGIGILACVAGYGVYLYHFANCMNTHCAPYNIQCRPHGW